jgi:transposase-like protein
MGGMKNDSVSRRRFSSQERTDLIAQYQRSGLTQQAFVEKHRFGLATLTKWLRQHRQFKKQSPAKSQITPAFQALDLSRMLTGTSWAAEIVLPEGATVRLSAQADAPFTSHLLQTLRRAC